MLQAVFVINCELPPFVLLCPYISLDEGSEAADES